MRTGPASGSSLGTVCSHKLLDGVSVTSPTRRGFPGAAAGLEWHSGAGVLGSWLCPEPSGGRIPVSPQATRSGSVHVKVGLMCPSGGRGPLHIPTDNGLLPTPPKEAAGLQLRGVGRQMSMPTWLAPSSPTGSHWTWHSCSGAASATLDPFLQSATLRCAGTIATLSFVLGPARGRLRLWVCPT